VNSGYSLTVFRNLVLPALFGAALGAYLVRLNDRYAPWDAIGVAGLAAVLFFATPGRLFQSPSIAVAVTMVAAAVVSFTAATGLARLAGDGPGLAGGAVGGSTALGLAALVICEPVVAPVMSTGLRGGSGVPTAGVVALALTAIALLVLHLRGTRVGAGLPVSSG
jgi:hypothetical protein